MTGVLVFLAIVAGLIVALTGYAPETLDSEHNRMSLVYYLCWLVVAGGAIFATFRNNWAEAARSAVIWIVIALALVAGYSVKDDLREFGQGTLAALVPGMAISGNAGEARLRRTRDGHFYVRARVDGEDIRFVVDTGASMVVLSAEDAARLGLKQSALDYNLPVQTANGGTMAAPIRLHEIIIGEMAITNIRAAVMRPGQLETSLLGMSYLNKLSAFSFEGDTLILRR